MTYGDLSSEAFRTKRGLLKGGAIWPITWTLSAGMVLPRLANADVKRLLSDLLDVLIPQDISPSATQLKVDVKILEYTKTIPNYEPMIYQGMAWLDQQARSMGVAVGFVGLSPEQKNQTIAHALKQPQLTLPKVFMQRLMEDAFRLYYSHPSAYRVVKSMQPLQPMGYPKHHLPP